MPGNYIHLPYDPWDDLQPIRMITKGNGSGDSKGSWTNYSFQEHNPINKAWKAMLADRVFMNVTL